MERHSYFYPGSFELKLIQSTRQGDFSFLNKDLIHYNQTDYNHTTTVVTNNAQVILQVTNTTKT